VLAFDIEGNPVEGGFKPDGEKVLDNPTSLRIVETSKKRSLLVLNTGSSKVSVFELESKKNK
jgi:predicted phosphodiesterase